MERREEEDVFLGLDLRRFCLTVAETFYNHRNKWKSDEKPFPVSVSFPLCCLLVGILQVKGETSKFSIVVGKCFKNGEEVEHVWIEQDGDGGGCIDIFPAFATCGCCILGTYTSFSCDHNKIPLYLSGDSVVPSFDTMRLLRLLGRIGFDVDKWWGVVPPQIRKTLFESSFSF